MSRRNSIAVLTASIVAVVAAGTIWVLGGTDDRADLIGEPATTTTAPTTTAPTTTSTSTTVAVDEPEVPVSIAIPAIGVDAPVVPVGLEPNGEMEVPPAEDAGWYHLGPRPGQQVGNSVIAAHVDFGGRRGVFFDLRSLEVGAEVVVRDAGGAARTFVVTERYQVDKDELPIADIFVGDGPPGLTLITCGGSFDRSARSYQDNIVVHTVPA